MSVFGTLNLHFDPKKWIFPNMIFQLFNITSLILDQLACSLSKTNTTFHMSRKMQFFHKLDEKLKLFWPTFINNDCISLNLSIPKHSNNFLMILADWDNRPATKSKSTFNYNINHFSSIWDIWDI